MNRRRWLGWGLTATGVALWPDLQLVAQQAQDFVVGPPMPDIPPVQVSKRTWVIYAADGFPTPENKGMMSNVTFVTTSAGVVILDSGSSLQIGEMAIRMIKRVTSQPVVAVFNSHFHGDHWLGNHAFVKHFGSNLPIYALPHAIEQIKGIEGSSWRNLMERWTNQSTAGTQVVAPNRPVAHGQSITIGDVEFKLHFYGQAHTRADLSVQVVPDRVTHVGDIAMTNRIANILRMAASALSRSSDRMGEYVRRFKGRLGKAEGIVAGAHKLARIIWVMIFTGQPYDEPTEGR